MQRVVRVAFAGTNDQPYRSPAQWLQQQGVASLPPPWTESMKAWAAQNPQRVNQLLWSNPRYIFFREEALSDFDAAFGPKGAQGVALTPGRSIAVDPGSIPYGTPVWLASTGRSAKLQKAGAGARHRQRHRRRRASRLFCRHRPGSWRSGLYRQPAAKAVGVVAEMKLTMTKQKDGMTSQGIARPARALAALTAALVLAGCASGGFGNTSTGQRYRCEQGIEFSVKFVDDSALIDSSRGYNVLFRDAGGQTESQPVYSNAVVRAEFGLGANGREARLSYPLLPLVARCVQE